MHILDIFLSKCKKKSFFSIFFEKEKNCKDYPALNVINTNFNIVNLEIAWNRVQSVPK